MLPALTAPRDGRHPRSPLCPVAGQGLARRLRFSENSGKQEQSVNAPRQLAPIAQLGEPVIPSPLRRTSTPGDGAAKFTPANRYVRSVIEFTEGLPPKDDVWFEKAGSRERLFFAPAKTRAAIVTCGGLCPGSNNVITIDLSRAAHQLWRSRGCPGNSLRLPRLESASQRAARAIDAGTGRQYSRRGRNDPRVVPRAAADGGDGRLSRTATHRHAVLYRRRRNAARAHALYQEIDRRGARSPSSACPRPSTTTSITANTPSDC